MLVWAFPHSLATTNGIMVLFSFPVATKMFQFTTYILTFLWIQNVITKHYFS